MSDYRLFDVLENGILGEEGQFFQPPPQVWLDYNNGHIYIEADGEVVAVEKIKSDILPATWCGNVVEALPATVWPVSLPRPIGRRYRSIDAVEVPQ
jgi:hypothetical protein